MPTPWTRTWVPLAIGGSLARRVRQPPVAHLHGKVPVTGSPAPACPLLLDGANLILESDPSRASEMLVLAARAALAANHRRADARTNLRHALEPSERLGAIPWAELARTELQASGETARKRDPSTLDQLTQQERQVASLASQG